MSSAILLAVGATDDGLPAATLACGEETVLGRLEAQLRRLGIDDVHVLTRPRWRPAVAETVPGARVHAVDDLAHSLVTIEKLLAEGSGDVLLARAETVTLDSVIEGLLVDPRVPNGIVSWSQALAAANVPRVEIFRGRVVAVESAFHTVGRPTHAFLGIAKVSEQQRPELAEIARELSELVAGGPPAEWEEELASKITRWGQRFYSDRDSGTRALAHRLPFRRGADRLLADQLELLGRSEPWLPSPEHLRAELERDFTTEVILPAEALRDDAVALLVTGLVRRDVTLTSTSLRELFWDRPTTAEQADGAALAVIAIDEDRHLLNSAVKARDGFFTTFFVSPYSKYIARWCARRGFTPNQVTSISMLLGILSALAFATGTRAGLIAGAILLQVAFTTDCVDGQLARYTRQFSKLGAWLDSVFDRGKEYLVYAGLAVGAMVAGADATIWLLAGAALALQTTRHYLDFAYAGQQHGQLAVSVRGPLIRTGPTEVEARVATPDSLLTALGRGVFRLSLRVERRPVGKWVKRILMLPIGERFALISLTAALTDARTTFLALLIGGGLSATYTVAARIPRSYA